jgi:hypothetical protein
MKNRFTKKLAAVLAVASFPLFSHTTCTLDTPSGLYVLSAPGLRNFDIEIDDDEIEIEFDHDRHHDRDFFDRIEDWFD